MFYILLCHWLTSFSRASIASLSVIDWAAAISVERALIRRSDGAIALPHRSNWLGPSSVRNLSVRALYAASNFANPRLRSSSSTRDIENTKHISRRFCYHQSGVRVSCEPTPAAALFQAGREFGVH